MDFGGGEWSTTLVVFKYLKYIIGVRDLNIGFWRRKKILVLKFVKYMFGLLHLNIEFWRRKRRRRRMDINILSIKVS